MKKPALALIAWMALIQAGCRATPPSSFETSVMNSLKRVVFVRNKSEVNPISYNAASQAAGKEAFSHYCIVCHGLDGQNTGVPFADHMCPPVPSLASSNVQSYTDGQLKWIIDNGIKPSGMPSSRGMLTDEEIWSIVVYIRHLPPAGSLGEPKVYSGE